MNEEEVHGGGDGGHTGGVPGPPGGAGVDFHVRAHTTIRSYDNRKSKYWLYCKTVQLSEYFVLELLLSSSEEKTKTAFSLTLTVINALKSHSKQRNWVSTSI